MKFDSEYYMDLLMWYSFELSVEIVYSIVVIL